MTAKNHTKYKQFPKGILCFLCFFVALSFFAVLVPIASASSNKSTMACCIGKAAGHCDSGIPAKRIPPPEPMCGLDNSDLEDDEITIVAEPSHNESLHASQSASTHPAAEPLAISQPCPIDCGACTVSSARQQRRERGIVQPATYHNAPVTSRSDFDNLPFSWLSNADLEQASPRGPPSHLP